MSDFFSKAAANTKLQFAATAIISGATVACSILGYQHLHTKGRISKLKESIPSPEELDSPARKVTTYGAAQAPPPRPSETTIPSVPPLDKEDARNQALAARAQKGDFDDDLILEQLARNGAFLTPGGLEKLRGSFVVVVGCGGVGSHCTAALARSGVERIRLVDFDQVTLSSLNRHAVATLADVGTRKVECLVRRLRGVTPWTRWDLRGEKFDEHSAEDLLGTWVDGEGRGERTPSFVVDAIDNIDTKVALLRYCHEREIPVISSMGAACKSDPTRICVGDIGTSTDDGLSRACRRRLKTMGITHGIPVVYSQEKGGEGKAELLPLPEEEFQKGQVGDLGVLPDFRVRILPVLGTMPAVFGYTIANFVILRIAGYPMDYRAPTGRGREKLYEGVQGFVQASEERIAKGTNPAEKEVQVGLKTPVTTGDVAVLVEEVFRGRSVVSGLATRLVLVRWGKLARKEGHGNGTELVNTVVRIGKQKSSSVRFTDMVCMTKDEAMRHEREVVLGEKTAEELYGEEVLGKVEERLKEAAEYEKYR
ncbi:ubiquitin-protein ligase molybdopterin-converting factor [Zalerion maritima]|uniref:Ubiquitin-protein ligase molybdopterin-converting factor n=1 Tax=Zalerion maritima TaxID=339359 RepID=A0AAD5RHY7_9PEZI|nr:ubiquitin-protein ligase molybdopterin-converting factor [Zalerion maritima]